MSHPDTVNILLQRKPSQGNQLDRQKARQRLTNLRFRALPHILQQLISTF